MDTEANTGQGQVFVSNPNGYESWSGQIDKHRLIDINTLKIGA